MKLLSEGGSPNIVENLSTDVTNDDQKIDPTTKPAFVIKFLMII